MIDRNRILRAAMISGALITALLATPAAAQPAYFDVVKGAGPHDVAASPNKGGPVYYTAQRTGKLGILDPASGKVEEIALGPRSSPHGVIVGPDGGAWITDGGQNAIVRVDPATKAVKVYPLPADTGYTRTSTR
jgi:virginiamycin B lyase